MNSSLKLFTQSDLLLQLGVGPLRRFLSRFINSDARLASLDLDSPYLCSELARLFTQPQSLSPRLCETLVLLETATLPEHCDRLAALAQQRLPDLCVTEFHPLALALELWLAFPDDLTHLCSSSSSSSSSGESAPAHSAHGSAAARTQESTHPSIHLSASASSIEYPVSSIEHPASSIEYPASSIEHPPSSIEYPPSSIEYPPSSIEYPPSSIEHPASSIQNPASSSLLASLASLLTRYVILPEHAAEALALWIVHTYAFELRDVTTYLGLESPVRRCGKSTLLTVLSRLVNRPLVAANVSPSALYRAIEELRPTLMIDEADTFLKPNDELIGILNAGYHRATAYVLRVASERSSGEGRIHVSGPNSAPDESKNQHAAPTEFEKGLRSDGGYIDVAPTELERRLRDGGYRHGAPTELFR